MDDPNQEILKRLLSGRLSQDESVRLNLGLRRGSEFIHPQEFSKRQEQGRYILADDVLNIRIAVETMSSEEFINNL